MLELNLAKAMELVDMAVAERGADYIYVKPGIGLCLYVHGESFMDDEGNFHRKNQTAGCLVGMALNLGGIGLDILETNNEASAYTLLDRLEQGGHIRASEGASDFLADAQERQDRGESWGDSRRYAKENIEE